ncbi:MAG TPA: amino acid dehydrogenase, partial [Rhodococcus sp. (in: high G+C Gram-positive bacteria)]|nr:amino acid dehydrogenase [Rhodococcus sp. (in: high G+C Gram-positive bacteria)]
GMARAFAQLMEGEVDVSDAAIFGDVSDTIATALRRCHDRSHERTGLAATAFEIALDQLVPAGERIDD